LPRAFAARGWTANGSLDLEVKDDLLPANDGRFVLAVADGRANVERGGRGAVQLDIRALASLFTSHMRARDLALMGSLRASEDDLARADALFASPSPCLADFF
ncbi:MAG TPA: sterol carrier protein domain-containing protein, partial [Labilithrix sp.]